MFFCFFHMSTPQTPVRIHLNPEHHLTGYHAALSEKTRRAKLRLLGSTRASALWVIRRLNVLVIFNKRRHPDLASIFRDDMAYMHRRRLKLSH